MRLVFVVPLWTSYSTANRCCSDLQPQVFIHKHGCSADLKFLFVTRISVALLSTREVQPKLAKKKGPIDNCAEPVKEEI